MLRGVIEYSSHQHGPELAGVMAIASPPDRIDHRLVIRRVTRRLIPFAFICYVVAYIDRVNIGFAASSLQRDLGLSDAAYGFGAGLFFLGYFLFEIPSNLLLERVGARRGVCRHGGDRIDSGSGVPG